MRHSKLVIPFLLAAAFAAGCKSTAEKSTAATKQDQTAALQLGKAKAATIEAAQALEDYAYTRKAQFVAMMNKELVATQEELDRLAAKVENSTGAAKAEAKTKLEAVRQKFAQTKQRLDQAENATEATWKDVISGFKESYAGLKDSIAITRQWLSDKIAP
jgi:tRNA pseudouridine synthase D (TruD).